jgi:hypothetical protein
MKPYEIFTKLAETARADPEIIPLVLLGVSLGVVENYIKPAIHDVGRFVVRKAIESTGAYWPDDK